MAYVFGIKWVLTLNKTIKGNIPWIEMITVALVCQIGDVSQMDVKYGLTIVSRRLQTLLNPPVWSAHDLIMTSEITSVAGTSAPCAPVTKAPKITLTELTATWPTIRVYMCPSRLRHPNCQHHCVWFAALLYIDRSSDKHHVTWCNCTLRSQPPPHSRKPPCPLMRTPLPLTPG